MQRKEKKKRSKLKLRPYGVITIQTGEPDSNQDNHTTALLQTENRSSSNTNVHKRTNILSSLLKGSTVFLLIGLTLNWTMAFNWTGKQSFRTPSLDSSIQATSSTSRPIDTGSQSKTSNKNEIPHTNKAPTPPAETVGNNFTESRIEKNKTEAVQKANTQIIVPTKSNSPNPVSVDTDRHGTNPSATDAQLDVSEPVAVENTPMNKNASFIKAYKASVFSSLSASATETPVSHGAAAHILGRVGDWVKVEVPADNITGFIHITHLTIH